MLRAPRNPPPARPVLPAVSRAYAILFVALIAAVASAGERIRIVSGVENDGKATELWQAMARKRHPDAKPLTPRPMSDAHRRWADLIASRKDSWHREIPALAKHFEPVAGPDLATIVVGNQGAEDAFTHDPRTIGFDVSRLHDEYGDAALPENAARIDRFFRHEYVHLLQKAWVAQHPWDAGTPLRAALFEIWAEGLGNYYSLSSRWHSTNGEPSPAATRALNDLTPRFITRFAALACTTEGTQLTADLSNGAFDRKWGALPVALWLDAEARNNPDAIRKFVLAGPEGVWALAERHVSERAFLAEARAAASLCEKRP